MLKLSIRIPLGITIAVIIIGIIAFSRIFSRGGMLPTTYFIVWIAAVIILIGITIWSWVRSRKKKA